MNQTQKTPAGTSFHGEVFKASVSDLRQILGEPIMEDNSGEDKTNFEWVMETETGDVFAVYDWKHYRPLEELEIVEWHIGSRTPRGSEIAVNEIASALNNL